MIVVSLLMIYLGSLILAALFGFATHRAGFCTVRAIVEIASTRRFYMILAFIKMMLWTVAISMFLAWFWPFSITPVQAYPVTSIALLGGMIFGMGSALNRGCTFSTLQKLANGDLWMGSSILGFALGIVGYKNTFAHITSQPIDQLPLLWQRTELLSLLLFLSLAVWSLWEMFYLWKSRPKSSSFSQLFFSKYYRLSSSALLLGVTGGILFFVHRNWTYPATFENTVDWAMGRQAIFPLLQLNLFFALLAGMFFSAWQRGTIQFYWKSGTGWVWHFIGGILMGTGIVMIPGGNDTLLLQSIPAFSPHALPTYLALLVGITIPVFGMKLFSKGKPMSIDCSQDICREKFEE